MRKSERRVEPENRTPPDVRLLEKEIARIDPREDALQQNAVTAGDADGGPIGACGECQRGQAQSPSGKVDVIVAQGEVSGIEVGDGIPAVAGVAVIEDVKSSAARESVVAAGSGEAVVLDRADPGMGEATIDEDQVFDVWPQRVGGQKRLHFVGAF